MTEEVGVIYTVQFSLGGFRLLLSRSPKVLRRAASVETYQELLPTGPSCMWRLLQEWLKSFWGFICWVRDSLLDTPPTLFW